ncbi:hypothetical protein JXA32_13290 [Candidatus Sumerlaeota bacterium]|nr:hypothetical protein [Candidatus Sumerlaeota bacterium]
MMLSSSLGTENSVKASTTSAEALRVDFFTLFLVFFAAVFLAAVFFVAVFLTAAFLTVFVTAVFLAADFFTAVFFTAAFFVALIVVDLAEPALFFAVDLADAFALSFITEVLRIVFLPVASPRPFCVLEAMAVTFLC